MHSRRFIITPIAKNYKTAAEIARGRADPKRDYEEQKRLSQSVLFQLNGEETWCWDDSDPDHAATGVPAKVGDLFGFYFYGEKVIVHEVVDVADPAYRLESWAANIGQRNRNVLILSAPIGIIGWDRWIGFNGAKTCRSTYNISIKSKKNKNMMDAIQNILYFREILAAWSQHVHVMRSIPPEGANQ